MAIGLIVFIAFMSWNQGRKTAKKLLDIERELIRSKMRQELHLEQMERLIIDHKTIAIETIQINKKHEEIRSNPITDPIRDSLARSIIKQGEARFD